MKIRFAWAAITAALLSTPALASGPGAYIGLDAGINIPANSTPDLLLPPNPLHEVHTSFSPGWAIDGAVGYKFTSGYRTELEVGYRQASLSHMDDGPAHGHQGTLSVMGNAIFDVGQGLGFQPYLGAGVGAAWMKWHNVQSTLARSLVVTTPVFDDGSPTAFQYQGIVGISFPITPVSDLFFDYRYIGITGASFTNTGGSTFTEHKDASHNLMVGIRFPFGAL